MTSTLTAPTTRLVFVGDLRPHQSEAVSWLLERPKAVLADDVGLGKAVTALALIARLAEAGELESSSPDKAVRVLWVTESGLVAQAASEISRFLPDASVVTALDPELGTSAAVKTRLDARAAAGIDLMVLGHQLAHSRRGWIEDCAPALVVIDEASRVKSGGKHAGTLRRITRRTPRVLSMTATPLENQPIELWELLSVTDTPDLWPPLVYQSRFVMFREVDYGYRFDRTPIGWQPGAAQQVRPYVNAHILRRTVQDIGLDLPVLKTERRWVPLTAKQQHAYDAAARGDDLAAFWRQSRAGLAHGESSPLVAELIAELGRRPDSQAVVYCESLEMLDLAEAALEDAGISLLRIEGEVSDKQRAERVEAFRQGGVRVLLGSSVIERGLNLQHCPLLISLDASWNPAREDQRAGRIRRIGSPFAEVEHLVLLPDTPLVKAKMSTLDRKQSVREAVGL